MGTTPPPQKIMYQNKKMATARKMYSSLQDDPTKS
jgi:hypothetical protein